MKRFLIFSGEDYYPNGGAYDLLDRFNSIEECKMKIKSWQRLKKWNTGIWAHIFDLEKNEIVYEYSTSGNKYNEKGMKAFHNDIKIKEKYIARLKAHRLADHLIKGQTGKDGKGCAVWCTLEQYNHSAYETELGIPEWLARLEDRIFEWLSYDRSQKWPEEFLEAITPGVDLNTIEAPFVIFVLKSTLENFDHKKYPEVVNVVNQCIHLYERSPARSGAESAADSAV